MVLDYAIDEMGIKQKRLRLNSIATKVQAHPEAGTAPGNIELINGALLESFPEIQMIDNKGGTWSDIKNEIDEGRPIVAWIVIARDEGDIIYHSVVINGYDDALTTLYYIDPEQNEDNYQLSAPIGTFIDDWLTVDGHLIKMKTTIKGQQDLHQRLLPLKGVRKRRVENE